MVDVALMQQDTTKFTLPAIYAGVGLWFRYLATVLLFFSQIATSKPPIISVGGFFLKVLEEREPVAD